MVSQDFSQEYAEARIRFRTASREAGGMVESYILPMQGPHGEQLATDVTWFGPKSVRRVFVILSGVHGVRLSRIGSSGWFY
ncbi:DUF2817 domain-containing protein [Caballeronia sp. GAOx1]|uniref:DUF2817 domain-containing protein n=1 Tax=Caballeronia sp. GAOx1 TaxID=2921761 RepID=UPI0032EC1C72